MQYGRKMPECGSRQQARGKFTAILQFLSISCGLFCFIASQHSIVTAQTVQSINGSLVWAIPGASMTLASNLTATGCTDAVGATTIATLHDLSREANITNFVVPSHHLIFTFCVIFYQCCPVMILLYLLQLRLNFPFFRFIYQLFCC